MADNVYELIVENAPNMIWMSGKDKLCYYFNRSWLRFTGRSIEQEQGNGWAEGVHPEDLERCINVYEDCFEHQLPFYMEYRLRRADGEYRWISDQGTPVYDDDKTFLGYLGSCLDIHEKIMGQKVIDMAYYDSLTRLHSRQFFIDKLTESIQKCRQGGSKVALALIDLDNFKHINDTYGHRSGDIVLMKVAEVIKGTVRAGDVASRYGGDEFVLMLEGADVLTATAVAHRIDEEIASLKFDFGAAEVHVSASIGIAEFEMSMSLESFITSADKDMYHNKRRRKHKMSRESESKM